jgi:hypothetical protein
MPVTENEKSAIEDVTCRPVRGPVALFGMWIAFATLVLIVANFWLSRFINPIDINHVTILNASTADRGTLSRIDFESDAGDVRWHELVARSLGPWKVATINIEHAWLKGRLTMIDSNGTAVAACEVTPRGRYSGTLVVVFDEFGKVETDWNSMPQSTRNTSGD